MIRKLILRELLTVSEYPDSIFLQIERILKSITIPAKEMTARIILIGLVLLISAHFSMAMAEEYQGKVGKLDAVFDIDWGGDETVGGTYYYPSRKGVIYKLQGEFADDGKLVLREYTNGAVTAIMTLSETGGQDSFRWSGKMKNTDGREFEMWFGE